MHILDSLLAFCAYFYWRGHGDRFSVYILKITPHNEWQLIKIIIRQHHWPLAARCWATLFHYPARQLTPSAFRIIFPRGGIALVIQLVIYGGVRLYMPALVKKIINHNTAAGLFMGTAAWRGILTPPA